MSTFTRFRTATWLVIGLGLVIGLLNLDYNGPFFDEAIYITAGQRTLEGYGTSDSYLTWFGGSLGWPVLAAVGYNLGGLIGTRVLALLLTTAALTALAGATENLFGRQAGFWAALAMSLNGLYISLARLGVYDTLALAAIATGLWAITQAARQDSRSWLVVAAISLAVAVLAKYPMVLMAGPLVAILILLRRGRWQLDLAILAFVSAALLLAFFLPAREQIAGLAAWRLGNTPTFGVAANTIAFAIIYYTAPVLVLSAAGWLAARKDRLLATILLASLAIWPAYHLLQSDPTSLNKHLVFGFLLAYPLIGLALSWAWSEARVPVWLRRGSVVMILLALLGAAMVQVSQNDRSWPDSRPAAAYLVNQVQPGDELLVNESWPLTMYLYTQGRINSPWDVYDAYRVAQGEAGADLCSYGWFVDVRGSYDWSPDVLRQIEECGTFEPVSVTTSMVTGLGNDLRFVAYPVETVIWRNRAEAF